MTDARALRQRVRPIPCCIQVRPLVEESRGLCPRDLKAWVHLVGPMPKFYFFFIFI
nr:hypothetical protein [Cressdnaviricota sp.]